MKRGRRAPPAAGRPTRRLRRRHWIAGGLLLVALIGAATWMLTRTPAPRVPPRLDAQGAALAYQRGLDLANARRTRESIPEFRRAAEARPDLWNFHHDYAAALLSAAHEGRSHHGRLEFVVRSSAERIALIREGLAELEAALRVARDRRAQAQILRTRAQILKAWGLPWDALVSYRGSEWSDTTWTESVFYSQRLMDVIEDPTRPGED